MAPARKASCETSISKTTKQQRRVSQRVLGIVPNQVNTQEISLTQKKKQSRSKRRQKKTLEDSENELHIMEENTSKENPKSMSIDSNDVGACDEESSISSCSNTNNASSQIKASSGVHFDIADDDDSNEFQAMFMANATLSKRGPNHSSTPLVRHRPDQPSVVRTTAQSASSHQMKKPTHRFPLATITSNDRSTQSKSNTQNLSTPNTPRSNTYSSPATQMSVGNQSLSGINHTSNNHAVLETFSEYRNLRRDYQRKLQQIETWKADYETLTRQMQKIQNNSVPRPSADGLAFLEQLLESYKTREQGEDTRTLKELAGDIGLSEATLLSTSTPDPQKTALKVFNHLFPSAEEKEVLINAQFLKAEYPRLLDDILVWSKRCTPGCGYTLPMLNDAIGNSIRCARHKLKTDHARLVVATTVKRFETTWIDDEDIETMFHDNDEL